MRTHSALGCAAHHGGHQIFPGVALEPLASSFNHRSPILRPSSLLPDEQIRAVATSIFAESTHDSRSERYTYIAFQAHVFVAVLSASSYTIAFGPRNRCLGKRLAVPASLYQ